VPGIAFVVIGVLALAEAPAASVVTAIYLGAMLCVAGGFAVAGGALNIGRRGALLALLVGILSVLVGVAVLRNPIAGAFSLAWLMAAWFAVGGLFEVALAFTLRSGRGWLILVGSTNLILGALVLIMGPLFAFYMLGYLVGVSFLIRGLWSVVFVGELHHARSEVGIAVA